VREVAKFTKIHIMCNVIISDNVLVPEVPDAATSTVIIAIY